MAIQSGTDEPWYTDGAVQDATPQQMRGFRQLIGGYPPPKPQLEVLANYKDVHRVDVAPTGDVRLRE